MTEFAYNNAKNTVTSEMLFKLNCSYHIRTSYEEDID